LYRNEVFNEDKQISELVEDEPDCIKEVFNEEALLCKPTTTAADTNQLSRSL
jgi:hypothetical protein